MRSLNLFLLPLQAIAKRITSMAFKAGEGAELTPYAEAARLAGQAHEGGRRDDMTAIVAFVL